MSFYSFHFGLLLFFIDVCMVDVDIAGPNGINIDFKYVHITVELYIVYTLDSFTI